jgi:hypothetical protein
VKLEAYNHKLSQLVPPLYEQATEICIKPEERVAAEKLRLNGKSFLLVDKDMMASPAWVWASENDNKVLLLIDAALGVQINDGNLPLGFSLAGSTGVVLTLLPSDHAALMTAEWCSPKPVGKVHLTTSPRPIAMAALWPCAPLLLWM